MHLFVVISMYVHRLYVDTYTMHRILRVNGYIRSYELNGSCHCNITYVHNCTKNLNCKHIDFLELIIFSVSTSVHLNLSIHK